MADGPRNPSPPPNPHRDSPLLHNHQVWSEGEDAALAAVLDACAAAGTTPSFAEVAAELGARGLRRSSDGVRQRLARMRAAAAAEGVCGSGTSDGASSAALASFLEYAKRRRANKSFSKTYWTPCEDAVLLFAHSERGEKWREISAHFLTNRSDTAIRNRVARLRKTGEAACASSAPVGWLEAMTVDALLVDALVLFDGEL